MQCPRCQNFVGSPCTACRTWTRIGFLLERGQIPVWKEAEVVAALRNAVGVFSDLVEQFGLKPYGPAAPGGSGDIIGGPTPLVEDKRPAEEPSRGAKDPEVPKKEKKRPKKDKVKKAEETGAEEAPGEKEAPKESRILEGPPEESVRSTARGGEVAPDGERLQRDLDHYVSTNPATFGLGRIEVRGSAGRHFADREEQRRRERPPEPEGPPPRREDRGRSPERHREDRERSRSRQKKKSKGAAHRKRGRDFWRGNRRQR